MMLLKEFTVSVLILINWTKHAELQFPVKVRSYRLRETPADTLRTWQIGALEV